MPIRPAAYSDLLPASKLLARAFKDEHVFGTFMHPHLARYPDDMYLWFLRLIRVMYVRGPDDSLLVSYTMDPATGKETMTGFAGWHRKGIERSTSYYNRALTKAMQAYNYLESFVYPNRAADPSRASVFARSGPFTAHHWTGSRAEVWDLNIIAVDTTFQGQGVGPQLVTWGFDKAKEEGVGCSVISAEGKERFYQKCGFDVIVGRCADEGGEDNPLRTIPGGSILFWDNGRDLSGVKKYGEL